LFEVMACSGADFGFAATNEEYEHRNRIFVTLGEAHIASWVGRDLKKYVPGLFWRTMLSHRLISERMIDLSNPPKCVCTELVGDCAVLLKIEGRITAWRDHAEEIDRFCEVTPGFFSTVRVEDAVACAKNYLMFNQAIADWR